MTQKHISIVAGLSLASGLIGCMLAIAMAIYTFFFEEDFSTPIKLIPAAFVVAQMAFLGLLKLMEKYLETKTNKEKLHE